MEDLSTINSMCCQSKDKKTTYTDIHTNVSIYTGNGTNWYKKENNIESPKNKTHPILHLSHKGVVF